MALDDRDDHAHGARAIRGEARRRPQHGRVDDWRSGTSERHTRDRGRGGGHGRVARDNGPVSMPDDWRQQRSRTRGGATNRPQPQAAPASVTVATARLKTEASAAVGSQDVVRGDCLVMCPPAEQAERERLKEISRFEVKPEEPASCEHRGGSPDAFTSWVVKKYRRPAAGRVEIDRTELRPPSVLVQTLVHLFSAVLPWSQCGFDWSSETEPKRLADYSGVTEATSQNFLSVYHFVSDRVRSVRQDFVIQREEGATRIMALEQSVRFYILASHRARLCLPVDDKGVCLDWSETLNDQQLASALTELHALYHHNQVREVVDSVRTEQECSYHQEEMLAYDVLLHLPDPQAVSLLLLKASTTTALSSNQFLKNSSVRHVVAVFVAFQTNDYRSFFHLSRTLPTLQRCLVVRHVPVMWTNALMMMNKAYGKQDRMALHELAHWMDIPSLEDTSDLCRAMNLQVERSDVGPSNNPPPSAGTIATVNSWEDGVDPLLPPAPSSLGGTALSTDDRVVRFKTAPVPDGLDALVTQRLLVSVANALQRQDITPCATAATLILSL